MSLKNILTKLLKQRTTSPVIGAFINAYSATAILYSPLTLIGVATTLYGLWGGQLIREYIPWFTTWMLLLCMVGFILVMMIFFYKIVIPSQYAFNVQQSYKHQNPMVTDILKGLENDEAILRKLNEIEKRLEKLEQK